MNHHSEDDGWDNHEIEEKKIVIDSPNTSRRRFK
jgi:hypothetical protein